MLTAFLRAFRTPDLRRKLLFTICMIAVFRLGAALPTPGISESAVHACTQSLRIRTSKQFGFECSALPIAANAMSCSPASHASA